MIALLIASGRQSFRMSSFVFSTFFKYPSISSPMRATSAENSSSIRKSSWSMMISGSSIFVSATIASMMAIRFLSFTSRDFSVSMFSCNFALSSSRFLNSPSVATYASSNSGSGALCFCLSRLRRNLFVVGEFILRKYGCCDRELKGIPSCDLRDVYLRSSKYVDLLRDDDRRICPTDRNFRHFLKERSFPDLGDQDLLRNVAFPEARKFDVGTDTPYRFTLRRVKFVCTDRCLYFNS